MVNVVIGMYAYVAYQEAVEDDNKEKAAAAAAKAVRGV